MTTSETEVTIEDCLVLNQGDTPWSYATNPGHLPGPWGETEEEALRALRDEAALDICEWWRRGATIYVIVTDAHSSFSITLGRLAEEYGIPLDHLGEFRGGDLTEYANIPVEISHDDNEEEEGWHVGGELVGLDDDTWAPQSDAQAADLRKAALAAE